MPLKERFLRKRFLEKEAATFLLKGSCFLLSILE